MKWYSDPVDYKSSWRDRDNGVVAQPLLLRWNGMKWEPKRAMNTLEAEIPLLK